MIIFQSTRLQLDINSCSYQSYSVIVLILFCLAAPFLQPQTVFIWLKFNVGHHRAESHGNTDALSHYPYLQVPPLDRED